MIREDLTSIIIGCYYRVYNTMGSGFLERVYENAMLIALRKEGLLCERQKKIEVFFEGELVGEFYADIVVEECIILELKAAQYLCDEHVAQLLNYLKATQIEIGFVMNFGDTAEFRRKVYSNHRKPSLQ